jgi:hypothetical protein
MEAVNALTVLLELTVADVTLPPSISPLALIAPKTDTPSAICLPPFTITPPPNEPVFPVIVLVILNPLPEIVPAVTLPCVLTAKPATDAVPLELILAIITAPIPTGVPVESPIFKREVLTVPLALILPITVTASGGFVVNPTPNLYVTEAEEKVAFEVARLVLIFVLAVIFVPIILAAPIFEADIYPLALASPKIDNCIPEGVLPLLMDIV